MKLLRGGDDCGLSLAKKRRDIHFSSKLCKGVVMDLFVTMRWSCAECALAMNTCIHAIVGARVPPCAVGFLVVAADRLAANEAVDDFLTYSR